ncbi:hypothetical protein GS929_26145 [Rhodococcus hoagii]|nr:hypothetical protein [Prescottella equi]
MGRIVGSLGQASAAADRHQHLVAVPRVLEALLPVIGDILVPAVQTLADLMAAHPGIVTLVVGATPPTAVLCGGDGRREGAGRVGQAVE